MLLLICVWPRSLDKKEKKIITNEKIYQKKKFKKMQPTNEAVLLDVSNRTIKTQQIHSSFDRKNNSVVLRKWLV